MDRPLIEIELYIGRANLVTDQVVVRGDLSVRVVEGGRVTMASGAHIAST